MTATADEHRPLRVLFVTHNFPRVGGDSAGSFILRLAIALRQQVVHVDVIAPGAPGYPERDTLDQISVWRVRYGSDHAQSLAYEGQMAELVKQSWGGRLQLLRLLWRMRGAMRRALVTAHREGTPYDVIHAHWWFPAGLIAWMAQWGAARQVPLVITMHGSDVRLARSISASHSTMRTVLRSAHRVSAVSTWLAREAAQLVGMTTADSVGGRPQSASTSEHGNRRAIVVAPMPVDTSAFVPSAAPRNGRVLFVGRLNAQKGVADLLHALALLAETRTDHAIACDIVGDGPDRELLQTLAHELGLDDRLRWHGTVTAAELLPLYQQAMLTAMPSREEGLGLVAVESQLCETPVIAYDSGGVGDVVRRETGGTLVQVGDVSGLSVAIHAMATHPEHAAQCGRAARAYCLEHFGPSYVASQYRSLYVAAITDG